MGTEITQQEVKPGVYGFHSIGIPSEWGHPLVVALVPAGKTSFHSIGIPSEWGLTVTGFERLGTLVFPFNWDPQRVGTLPY